MDKNAITAEMSAQSKLVDGIVLDIATIDGIDRHIKTVENELNQGLAHIEARLVIQDFVPRISKDRLATKIEDDVWNSLSFSKTWLCQVAPYTEISYEKFSKGFGFFFKNGEVTFDVGVCEDADGSDWYFRIVEDKRESCKLTGASVDTKFRAFKHLGPLLARIKEVTRSASFYYHQAPASGNAFNRMSLDMREAFSPAELAEIDSNYPRILPQR